MHWTDCSISAIVIDHISRLYALDDSSAIVFAYYNYQDSSLDKSENILGNLIKQLCWKLPVIPQTEIDFYHSYTRDAREPGLVKLIEIFIDLANHFKQVFIVIDALDECKATERTKFLGFTTSLHEKSAKIVRTFITSRKETDIQSWFQKRKTPVIEVEAIKVDQDIKAFVLDRVNTYIDDGTLRVQPSNQDLRTKIVDCLCEKSEGM